MCTMGLFLASLPISRDLAATSRVCASLAAALFFFSLFLSFSFSFQIYVEDAQAEEINTMMMAQNCPY